MIAIIDYKAGNLTSVQRALSYLGQESVITADPSILYDAERIIFPGVGAAGKAMDDLKRLKIDRALWESLEREKPILGMVKGRTIRFPENFKDENGVRLKVPHMGWNQVKLRRKHPLFEGITAENEFYFVHAYYPVPAEPGVILGQSCYGFDFTSVISMRNLVAVQFHPEKSGQPGLRILSNFCQWDGKNHAEL
jgi:glutamine amidotransferase